jgi:hypothetical protein
MTYKQQLKTVQTIPVQEGETVVVTCPFCYGPKKLAVSKSGGKLLWYCYRASCDAKGAYSGRRNQKAVRDYLNNTAPTKNKPIKPIPSITTSVENHAPAMEYLKSVNSVEAYQNKYINVRYAPAEDRVLFYGQNGAVGRSLRKFGPKWLSYGELPEGIHVGSGDIAVLVEDTPSACAVSRLEGIVGVALLGTTVTSSIKKTLNKFTNKYLVLDKDASLKSIAHIRRVDRSLKVRLTNVDLKYMNTTQIYQLIKGYVP